MFDQTVASSQMVTKTMWTHTHCWLFLCATILKYNFILKCSDYCCQIVLLWHQKRVWQVLRFDNRIAQFKLTPAVLTLVVLLLCFSGWESNLQKCRNNCRQSKVRGQMMELCLRCDNTVWKRIWAEWKGGSGFVMLSLFVCLFVVVVTKW